MFAPPSDQVLAGQSSPTIMALASSVTTIPTTVAVQRTSLSVGSANLDVLPTLICVMYIHVLQKCKPNKITTARKPNEGVKDKKSLTLMDSLSGYNYRYILYYLYICIYQISISMSMSMYTVYINQSNSSKSGHK